VASASVLASTCWEAEGDSPVFVMRTACLQERSQVPVLRQVAGVESRVAKSRARACYSPFPYGAALAGHVFMRLGISRADA
jgi:hypothetical protein